MKSNILSGPPELEPITNESFGKILYKNLLHGGSRTAMVDAVTDKSLSYDDIRIRSLGLAKYMLECGLKENDVITICGPNSLDFYIPAIAAIYMGIIVAPISHAYVPREMVHAMNITKPKVIFCSPLVYKNILEASKELPFIEKIIVFGNIPGAISINDCIDTNNTLGMFDLISVNLDEPIAIMCSSGTTGQPKGVVLTHRNFIVCVGHLKRPDYGDLNSTKTGMALLPFFHAYGFILHLSQIIINLKMIVLPKFEEEIFLKSIEKHKITTLYLVPPLILFLAKHPLVSKYNLSSLQEIVCGAAPLRKDIQDMVKRRLKILNIRQGYGLTESTLAVTLQPLNSNKVGTSGVLTPSIQGKIINPDTGETLGPNKEGELCFKGPLIMKEYHNNPEATALTIDSEGWLHTGDLGYYDEDGFWYIVDRLKELIKFKGFQVPPAELEAILLKNPNIKDAAVIGIPDERSGELPLAFVVKAPNSNITEKEIIKYIEDQVSYHKRLHGGVIFVNEIPKNPSGKILRRILRESVKNMKLKSKM